MIRLLVLEEGVTEETFVNELLARHLLDFGYSQVSARLLGNARQRSRRGGTPKWPSTQQDLVRHLRSDSGITVALMVDYYALPQHGPHAWPGRAASTGAIEIERALRDCISIGMGSSFDQRRFIPHVMMHEFEAMLFSDCQIFGNAIGCPQIIPGLRSIRDSFSCPEEIDDTLDGAPSRRIAKLLPRYQKPLMGNIAALDIGLERIRSECPHFRSWLEQLETRGFTGD